MPVYAEDTLQAYSSRISVDALALRAQHIITAWQLTQFTAQSQAYGFETWLP